MPVPEWGEMQGLAGFLLNALDLRPLDFPDTAALDADQVVVVRALMLDFELRQAARGRHALGEMALFEHLQRPEPRDLADALGLERLVDVILSHMLFGVQQIIQDQLTLLGQAQALRRQMACKNFPDPGRIALASSGPGRIKNKFSGHLGVVPY